jgi:hypothetical protein
MYAASAEPGPVPISVKPSGPSCAVSRLFASNRRITSSVKNSIPQFVWWMTNHSRVPRSLYEMTSERIASSLARPPAFRMTCASPSASPAYPAGSSLASIQVKIAKCRAGGSASSAFAPNEAAYSALARSTSSRAAIGASPPVRANNRVSTISTSAVGMG